MLVHILYIYMLNMYHAIYTVMYALVYTHICTYNVTSHTALLAASVILISLLGEMLLVPLSCVCTLPGPLTQRCALVVFAPKSVGL